MTDKKELMNMARQAAERSYSPYSHFRVGAALLCSDGTVVQAANVENRSFGLTICAERSALVKAISMGHKEFAALAIACPDADTPVSPCGACRQVISEFTAADFPIIFAGRDADEAVEMSMSELLPSDALHKLKEIL